MKLVTGLIVLAAAVVPTIAHAQDEGAAEVIVSAMRRNADDYSADMPAVGLRRTADFAIQEVTITGDTRDAGQRADEIYAMLANAIAGASKAGVQLAFGERVVQAVTLKNYRDLSLERDSRPDSQQLKFLVKSPLAAGTDAASAQARINAFIKAVKPVGRALMEASGDLTLSVVAPDQYRGAIADAIAADARTLSARFGPDYAVEVEGLNRPVEWARAGLSEVLLYIPYKLVIVPKR
ncbi:TonB-dependent receptor [Novosphingobium sp. MD-1]|uniref:TonB-dependent receptor n=1 Tax=Novosphingobium sp. MD-1 TaxID=1630648 RepID=UPI00061C0A29|nr:TonB-dependent receptor [Novosphingobium sp. MD-1]GAO55386.1 hypothetical protein NMD1_02497 [Novosphingobium sp. MD-1]